jgi:hypothetical protein
VSDDEIIDKIQEAAEKGQAQSSSEIKRMEMCREYFDYLASRATATASASGIKMTINGDEIIVDDGFHSAVFAPNDVLKDNQFIFEFEQ